MHMQIQFKCDLKKERINGFKEEKKKVNLKKRKREKDKRIKVGKGNMNEK